ncbi:GNAT family N-acetyltransferase [Shewanella sp. NIFS-20-20]|uniref:GNAT family N-acetyltransferase n=1 Tax=Shewanella sp. NIFS-20-20 TaxID=2853806 RepID=UPI001C45856F|nr:GNAT family N-acetyltransferase [Shewanella sp. NIFS-20-20]MBV7317126.1 GNAT family N-acetyltransferase [Shewanella sp. NIFS-20-20]
MTATVAQPRFQIIAYDKRYAFAISQLFHQAVRAIDHSGYRSQHLMAWSSAPRSARHWHQRLSRTQTWLAVTPQTQGWQCIGFINVESGFRQLGYIDSLYVSPDYQGQGVASALLDQLYHWALESGLGRLTVDASYLSRPVFAAKGFVEQQKIYQIKLGQMIPSFQMSLEL